MYSQIEEQALNKLYEILESPKDSTLEELKKSYRKLARKYHPDLNGDNEELIKKMCDINRAYDILTHPSKLREYLDDYIKNYYIKSQQSNKEEKNSFESSDNISVENTSDNDKHSWKDASYTIIEPSYETLEEFTQYLKEIFFESYQTVRYEEKAYTLKERYEDIYQLFSKYDYCKKIQSNLLKKGIKLATFSVMEFIYQLKKLKKQVDDTFPKYVIRNRKTLAGILAFTTLVNPANAQITGNNVTQSIQEIKSTSETAELLLDNCYKLVRMYQVQPGDTLSDIAINANTSIEQIVARNDLKSSELYPEQVIEIPYYIPKDELKYYTTSVNTEDFEKLEDLAEMYQTNIRTIYSINIEAFTKIDSGYMQISNELLVPTFPTKKEVNEQKSKDTYQKTSN